MKKKFFLVALVGVVLVALLLGGTALAAPIVDPTWPEWVKVMVSYFTLPAAEQAFVKAAICQVPVAPVASTAPTATATMTTTVPTPGAAASVQFPQNSWWEAPDNGWQVVCDVNVQTSKGMFEAWKWDNNPPMRGEIAILLKGNKAQCPYTGGSAFPPSVKLEDLEAAELNGGCGSKCATVAVHIVQSDGSLVSGYSK